MLMGQETMMNATITDAGFDIQLTLMEQPISISSNEDGVTVTKNEKNDAEEKWTIVLSGISIAMGEDVTVTLTSVTANKELSGKVELGGKLGSAFNKDLSNITFSAEV